MNLQNPYVLLRVLILLDVALMMISVYIPAFQEQSITDLFSGWQQWSGRERVGNVTWAAGQVVLIAAWIGLFLVQRIGVWLYLATVPIFAITYVTYGSGLFGVLVFDLAAYAAQVFYGFMMCMLLFGPVAVLFRRKP